MANPDFMALKKFVDERRQTDEEELLSEEAVIS